MEKHSNILDNKLFLLLISLAFLNIMFHPGSLGWIISPLFLIFIVTYVVRHRGYGHKLYIFSIFFVLLLECLLLTYVYLFDSVILKIPANLAWFLGFIVMTVLIILIYIRMIITGEYKKIPS